MKEHLTPNELLQALNKSPQSLTVQSFNHFINCEKCQQEYNLQLSADTLLKDLKPKSAPAVLVKNVLARLGRVSPVKVKEKTDWIFLISIILLFTITSWFIFSGRASSLIKKYTPDVMSEKQEVVEPGILDKIKDEVSNLDFSIELPSFNFGNIYLALGILAILFYILIDRKISKNFKMHKT